MDALEKIIAIEEIRALKARYFRCLDTKDWAGFGEVFAEDAVFDISDDVPGGVVNGRDKIVTAASVPLTDCVSIHHGHCPEIEIISATTASGIWAMEDMLRWSETADSPPVISFPATGSARSDALTASPARVRPSRSESSNPPQ